MMKAALSSPKRLFVGTSILLLLFLVPALVACSNVNSNSNATPTSTVKKAQEVLTEMQIAQNV